ncbi:ABC transporter ATP-binding protein [Helcobacillus sp. ACRRO]|uniref:ATP-binding cassette domain-containing protein n=1 Tax=Helcobacillus TaxID=1161125 RepID=UPI001EF49DC7|nr:MULTISPECIES: ABC transporter ATP-binding protein [Helcobacillus]MCG7427097.1 ABC transporter ATP-binding protein [Helcobacillus sp. ACRRO]MDK7742533.1 ABC transporter ATP-binding protein [Helcobacillus massiliensis]WOO93390.1 ABC transporter ATP-binding protein [Helcobacillus massiliensis]
MTLRITDLTFGYTPVTEALHVPSLRVDAGEICGLIGPNGSGKSTLVNLIGDALAPRTGAITVNGADHASSAGRDDLIVLSSNEILPEFLRGLEYIELLHRMHRIPLDEKRMDALFERYAMAGRQRDLVEDYSHGMRKKLQLIGALMLQRPLTLIDETLNGVDLDSLFHAREDLRALADAGSAILLVSHDFPLLESSAERLVLLRSGFLELDRPMPDVRREFGSVEALARTAVLAADQDEQREGAADAPLSR